jgi:hypothetical protein
MAEFRVHCFIDLLGLIEEPPELENSICPLFPEISISQLGHGLEQPTIYRVLHSRLRADTLDTKMPLTEILTKVVSLRPEPHRL